MNVDGNMRAVAHVGRRRGDSSISTSICKKKPQRKGWGHIARRSGGLGRRGEPSGIQSTSGCPEWFRIIFGPALFSANPCSDSEKWPPAILVPPAGPWFDHGLEGLKMPLDFCHPQAPHRKLRIPEWYVSSLMLDRALDAI